MQGLSCTQQKNNNYKYFNADSKWVHPSGIIKINEQLDASNGEAEKMAENIKFLPAALPENKKPLTYIRNASSFHAKRKFSTPVIAPCDSPVTRKKGTSKSVSYDESPLKRRRMDNEFAISVGANKKNTTNDKLKNICNMIIAGTNDHFIVHLKEISSEISSEHSRPDLQSISSTLYSLCVYAKNNPSEIEETTKNELKLIIIVLTAKMEKLLITKSGIPDHNMLSKSSWALAKFSKIGVMDDSSTLKPLLELFALYIKDSKKPFSSKTISNVTWAFAHFGELIDTNTFFSIFECFNYHKITNKVQQSQALWGLTVLLSRLEKPSAAMNKVQKSMSWLYKDLMSRLDYSGSEQKTYSTLAYAGFWLEVKDFPLSPLYTTRGSHSENKMAEKLGEIQREFKAIILSEWPNNQNQTRWPDLKLPPVDFYMYSYSSCASLIIEVQGPHHYIDRINFKIRNGGTLLKVNSYKNIYPVSEVATQDLYLPDRSHQYINEVKKLLTWKNGYVHDNSAGSFSLRFPDFQHGYAYSHAFR